MRLADVKTAVGCAAVGLLGLLTASCGGGAKGEIAPRYRAVRPGVAFQLIRDNPDLVVLDVRPFAEYCAPAGHLERAVSVPATQLDALWPALHLSNQDTVLLYSGDGGSLQTEMSRTLIEKGLRYVIQIDGGLEAWLADGFTVRVEDAPISPPRPQSPL